MNNPRRILIVEDELDLAEMLQYHFNKSGYQARVANDGVQALESIREHPPELVILDVMLPKLSGMEVARQVRTNPTTRGIPILMLTAKAEESDQISGLTAGADDYVTKPFSVKVLLARVETILRRTNDPSKDQTHPPLEVGPVKADLTSHVVTVDGEEIKLTLTEFKVLVALMQATKRVLSRHDLIARVMGPGIVVTARTIDVHIASIRKKLGAHGEMIRTTRGVGYQMQERKGSQARI